MVFTHRDTVTIGSRFMTYRDATNVDYPVDGQGTSQVAAITGATWTELTSTLTKTGFFAGYTVKAGDVIEITGGTGANTGTYSVASKTSDNAIVLATSIGAGADGQVDIAATFLDVSVVNGAVGVLITGIYVDGQASGTGIGTVTLTNESGTALMPLPLTKSANGRQQVPLPHNGIEIQGGGFGVSTEDVTTDIVVTYQEIVAP